VLTGSPGHLKTFDYLGPHRYSLTFCTNHRQSLFTTHAVVGLVLEQIARAADEQQFAAIAYCLMPDHVHLLVEGKSADSDGRNFIARAKQYSGFYYKREHRATLWQRYGFEHVLRDDELTLVVAKYILENPVRAGLVKRVEDYPFLGSLVYSLSELLEAIAVRSG
jgi:REP element-mobilizing transposase RayT